jgi:septum formation protein
MHDIILASKSKVRKDILSTNKIHCRVVPSNVDEDSVKISLTSRIKLHQKLYLKI